VFDEESKVVMCVGAKFLAMCGQVLTHVDVKSRGDGWATLPIIALKIINDQFG
jgi:hypothetical protein